MYKFARTALAAALLMLVAACEEQPKTPTTAAPAQTPEKAPSISPVDSLTKTVATDKLYTQIGTVVDGAMRNDGKAGFLIYGPYVPFAAGTYTVAIKGRIDELPAGQHVRLDVVSSRGNGKYVQTDVNEKGAFPAFDLTLPEAVTDLEVRVFVPAGSKVVVESYRVDKKP
jgi:hypothetical protein